MAETRQLGQNRSARLFLVLYVVPNSEAASVAVSVIQAAGTILCGSDSLRRTYSDKNRIIRDPACFKTAG